MEITDKLKKRFVSDLKLPINIYAEPYFQYFMELYDRDFNTKEKMKIFEKLLNKFSSQEEFFQNSEKISFSIKELIINTQTYKKFNSFDMNKYFPLEEQIKQQNIYINSNIGKKLISVDLEKANFNVFKMVGLGEEIGINSYDELLNKFTDDEYYFISKKIRQVIFGDLNPTRQQRIQKFVINNLCKKLKENGCILSSVNSDEIIIQNQELTSKEIKEILKNVPEKFKFFKIEDFILEKIDENHDFFVKKILTENGFKTEFKNIPKHLFAQVYKKYLNQEINEYDLLFYYEGFLAQFKEKLFTQELTKKMKIK
jgi:hypothetical protein